MSTDGLEVAIVRTAIAALSLSLVVGLAAPTLVAQRGTARGRVAPEPDPCKTKANQLELTECAASGFKKSDAAMTAVYRKLLADLDDEHKPLIEKAQRAWVVFRDAACELDASQALGGSMSPMLELDCRSAMTDMRVKDLNLVRKTLADFLR